MQSSSGEGWEALPRKASKMRIGVHRQTKKAAPTVFTGSLPQRSGCQLGELKMRPIGSGHGEALHAGSAAAE